jgi:amino acid adenylation domain-containing protein
MTAVSSLYSAFAQRVRRSPESVAVCASGEQVTYSELDARARHIAGRLRSRGVGPETLVGLCADRGVGLIAGMLGILAAGGAYLPLDPAYPDDRITFLIEDAGVKLVVGSGPVAARLARDGLAVVDAGSLPDGRDSDDLFLAPDIDGPNIDGQNIDGPHIGSANMAYVIYTSGSTGVPKGVVVEHRNVLRLFQATAPWFAFDEHDVWTLFHSVSFDFSVWEIWGALLHGGRLVIVPQAVTRVPAALLDLLHRWRVTVLNQTPSAFRQLIRAAEAGDVAQLALRYVIFGGERLDPGMLRPWFERYGDARPRLVNMYGITETTVHVTYRPIDLADVQNPAASPIGVPVPDLRVTLHDASGAEVADGKAGEIWVGGAGVARGYLNRPRLTTERFVVGPGGVRTYRSGDLAVRTPGGELEVLGRVDDQIKVRGYRIEPFEVESCLCGHPAVAAAVVAPRDYGEGDVRLVAYVQPVRGGPVSGTDALRLVEQLRSHAAAHLPAHLRPSNYELIGELPMTPHGKADRAALRRDGGAALHTDPDPEIAKAVNRIAERVLLRGAIPPDTDLFDLGATSLAFIRIITEVNAEFGIVLTGAELGDVASTDRLAAAVQAALDTVTTSAA